MEPSNTMFISLVATSGVFTTFLCLYACLKRAEIPNARTFIVYTAVQSIYIFSNAFEMASDTLDEIKLWTLVEYIGISSAPALGLILVLKYIGKSVSRKGFAAFFIIPAITLVMVSTNDYHHLFYKSVYFRGDTPVPTADMVIGEWYIVHGAFTFGCMLAAVVLLLRQWGQTKKSYRLQLITLIFGQFIPMTAAFVYLMGVTPYGMDPVPMVLCLTSAMYIWAMVSTRILTIVPIAKENIFESMREGVIVLDSSDRLIDFNGAVNQMIPELSTEMIGLTLDQVWERLKDSSFPVVRRLDGALDEIIWHINGAEYFYQVRSSPVIGRHGEAIGRLLMLIDVTESRLLQEQLKKLAYYDGMTGLLNRTQYILRSKEMLEEARLKGNPFSLILFDIDHFKHINDTFGHEMGDQAIVHVVSVVQCLLSPSILFARYGGEEFVLALPSYTLSEAGELAERIRTALAAETLNVNGHGRFAVTASFGAAQSGAAGDTLESLLRDADEALYQAKRDGRNLVRLFDSFTK
jgi:diguanylate cyclase (GGDEF)-like protein/PAS domain S-box-containing protein